MLHFSLFNKNPATLYGEAGLDVIDWLVSFYSHGTLRFTVVCKVKIITIETIEIPCHNVLFYF
jgi:hypothetical protein